MVFAWRALGEALGTFRAARSGEKLELALLLLRMKAKHFLIKLSPRFQFRRERLFGRAMECHDYYDFLCTFEILYIARDYRFNPSSNRPVIVDCGSNIGLSVLYFKREFPECKVTAFEPDPATFALLQRNVASNGMSGVALHNQAVCGARGEFDFFHDPAHPGSVVMSLRPECGLGHREKVEGVLLSDFINEDVDLLKVDVEGAELDVVEELVRADKLRRIDQIIVEYHPALFPKRDGLSWLQETLDQNGFKWEVRSGTPVPYGAPFAGQVTLYATRRPRPAGKA